MEYIICSGHCGTATLKATDIAYVKLYLVGHVRIFGLILMPHIILLLLITREDADLVNVGSKETVENCVSETTGTSGNHQGFSCKYTHMDYC